MSPRLASVYCAAATRDGSLCGNKVLTFLSGVYVRGPYCHVHRKRRGISETAEPSVTDPGLSGSAGSAPLKAEADT